MINNKRDDNIFYKSSAHNVEKTTVDKTDVSGKKKIHNEPWKKRNYDLDVIRCDVERERIYRPKEKKLIETRDNER